ncbi:DUF4937 domain-containing protein [Piscirickettsia litoralis]|uniref:DUF4937 domain-containing protein n=1 Tax=Piscirickettsia litoralis TaxID=1891921 RepID=A0ABX3ABV1_9GAMM|nr:DUF4937 domain-containing protein [Piscirickettsia litoralis]ODN43604.1 DUF4937 domain-containing protein [Piscirickettsia litoralis]
MLVQWICGEVLDNQRDAFAKQQSDWQKELNVAPGFVAQAGGWDCHNEDEVSVLDFWQDRDAFEAFNQRPHLELCGTDADNSCRLLSLSVFELSLMINGECDDFFTAISKCEVMRVAECTVKEDCVEHFLDAQRNIWAPGLKDAHALCAAVMHNINNPRHHFVVSLWKDQKEHKNYTLRSLPVLRSQSEILKDVDFLWGKLVNFSPDWMMIKK